jgi:hypothetical protein
VLAGTMADVFDGTIAVYGGYVLGDKVIRRLCTTYVRLEWSLSSFLKINKKQTCVFTSGQRLCLLIDLLDFPWSGYLQRMIFLFN